MLNYFRVAAARGITRPAETASNVKEIVALVREADEEGVSLVLFPELCVTGATIGDLARQHTLLHTAEDAVEKIADETQSFPVCAVVGAPVMVDNGIYNCSIVIYKGKILGMVPSLAARGPYRSGAKFAGEGLAVSYAGRDGIYFGPDLIFSFGTAHFAIETEEESLMIPAPSALQCAAGANLILCPGATPETVGAESRRRTRLQARSEDLACAIVHASAGYGESTGDGVYDGSLHIFEAGSFVVASDQFLKTKNLVIGDIDFDLISAIRTQRPESFTPKGEFSHLIGDSFSHVFVDGPRFEQDFESILYRYIEPMPFAPLLTTPGENDAYCSEALELQATGLASRMEKISCRKAVIGVSGGLDSTLALIVSYLAATKNGLDPKDIIGITMPGYGTSDRTLENAKDLMKALGITSLEIPIAEACDLHFRDIGHDKAVHNTTYENVQARERTQILMDYANSCGAIVVGTGDMSEAALGWCTYNGDHMSMYGVNANIPKTLVRKLVGWAADNVFSGLGKVGGRTVGEILNDVVATPVSPELVPGTQNTEDIIGPYELHDFFLYHTLKYGFGPEKILFLAENAFRDMGIGPSYDAKTIKKWFCVFIKRFFSNQFKRSCSPDGPQVTDVTLSPRGGWAMPSDSTAADWLKYLE